MSEYDDRDEVIHVLRKQVADLESRLRVSRIETARNRAMFEHCCKHLAHIHMLMHPRPITAQDGKVFSFKPPDDLVRETWEALSKAIREIPAVIDESMSAKP